MKEATWKNAEGMVLYALHWPVSNPRAVIVFVHGQGEHIGRYGHLARWFNAHGIAFLAFDQQGYGKSEGGRGHVTGIDSFLDDIGQFVEQARAWYPGIKLFLYGHSMGGNLALNYVLRRNPVLNGLIVTGPWIRLAFQPPALKIVAGKLLRRLLPTLTLPTGLTARFISRDESVVKAYISDPLVHNKVSAAAGIGLMEAAEWLNHFRGEVPVPMLLMHGGSDKLTDPAATRELAGRLSGDVQYQEWPGLYHEIHNEPEKEQVFARILNWIESK
jgi:alpha-beta hydrolase superfamily lysophospholipase